MKNLKNINELIIYLLNSTDQETIGLLLEGKLILTLGKSNYANKCSLKALKFLYGKLPKASEKILFYCSYDKGGENDGPIDLPDWISKEEYHEGVYRNSIIDVREIISKLGYYIDVELGQLLDSNSNSDGEGYDYWERLYYLKNVKFRRSQRLRDLIGEKAEQREFLRIYNSRSKKRKVFALS